MRNFIPIVLGHLIIQGIFLDCMVIAAILGLGETKITTPCWLIHILLPMYIHLAPYFVFIGHC